MSLPLLQESVWFDKCKFDDAERQFYESRVQNNSGGQRTISKSAQKRAKKQRNKLLTQEVAAENPPVAPSVSVVTKSSLAAEIAKARKHIQNSLQSPNETTSLPVGGSGDAAAVCQEMNVRLVVMEQENVELRQVAKSLQDVLSKMEGRISLLENLTRSFPILNAVPFTPLSQAVHSPQVAPSTQATHSPQLVSSNQAETNGMIDDEDDDIDLFGSDEDDEEADKLRQDRLKAYEEKKAKKPILIAKSNIILDVKPWDDETDMKEIEKCVRSIHTDGLLWGASKLVPLAYGINKLQIGCVVEDDKVGTDFLEENIVAFEELVQSVDIVAFNKI